jgi:predicted nucleotidyltransferase
VIYQCIIGSQAYGLADSESDIDRRGFYLPPAELHWSLYGVPEQLECEPTQEAYWEIQKFLVLALKANPNVLECLYTPLVEKTTPLADELLGMREMFLSRLVYQTYNGYVMSQFKKMQADIRNQGQVKWKHVMHLIRLLISGISVLRKAFVPVQVDDHREQLLAIKRGEVPWEETEKWRLACTRSSTRHWKRRSCRNVLTTRRPTTFSSRLGKPHLSEEPAMNNDPRLHKQVDDHPYPLLFATISGAHLYGFPVARLGLRPAGRASAAARRSRRAEDRPRDEWRSRASTTAWKSIS